jgi:hypothetical protein
MTRMILILSLAFVACGAEPRQSNRGRSNANNEPGNLSLFTIGADHSVHLKERADYSWGRDWSDWQNLGGYCLNLGNPVPLDGYGWHFEIFVRGGDNVLYHKWQDPASTGAWSDWNSLGGQIAGRPVAVTYPHSNTVEVYAVSFDHALWRITRPDTGFSNPAWGQWQSLGGSIEPGFSAYGDEWGVHVAARGTDGALYEYTNAQGWQNEGGQIIGKPIWGPKPGYFPDVFVLGGDFAIWRFDGATWSSLGGNVRQDPSLATDEWGDRHLFVVGGDQVMYRNSENGHSFGGWTAMNGVPFVSSSAVTNGSIEPPTVYGNTSSPEVFGFGTDGAWWHSWNERGQGWSVWTSLGTP